ncbi:MAG: ATP-binding protein [Chloroflexota bacterium]
MDGLLLRIPIRWRLALGYALFLLMIVGGAGIFLLTTLEANLLQEADETLAIRATHIAHLIAGTEGNQLDQRSAMAALLDLAPLEEFSAPGVYVQVLDQEGTLLASSPNLPGGRLPGQSEATAAALGGQVTYMSVPVGHERVRVLAKPVIDAGRQIGVVLVGESLHPQDVALSRVQWLLGLSAVAAALISLLSGWWLAGRAFRPIADVTRVAQRIAATGKFEQRITPPPVRDELGHLVGTFNEMLTRLDGTFRRHREFLADASHELRGPLMVIRGNLDLLAQDLPTGEREESSREAKEEAERMSRLLADLLFLAKSDAQLEMERAPVDLSLLVLEGLDRASSLDAGRHLLVLAHNEPLVVQGDRERLAQMLWNLLQNAVRYTPSGGEITLSLRRHEGAAELRVADTGIGIAPEHLLRIFERFYRVDPCRSREEGNTGLGLAIVKQVVEAHGGQVRVRSKPGEGSTFTVTLPLPED